MIPRFGRMLRVAWLKMNGWTRDGKMWAHPLASSHHAFTMEQALRITALTTPDFFGVLKSGKD